MKIEFDGKEIEEALIAKVTAMGIKANKCKIDAAYGILSKATIWYEEPIAQDPLQEEFIREEIKYCDTHPEVHF